MECPYCAERIKHEAIVCKSCGRDLKIVRPVMLEIRQLMLELDGLQRTIDQIDARLAFRDAPLKTLVRHSLIYVVPPILLLMLAHYLIIVVLDMSPVYLRLASLLIPLPFGIAARAFGRLGFRGLFLFGLLIAAISASIMLTVIGVIDGVSIIPSSRLEWREFAEFGSSIALAFVTGGILAHILLTTLPAALNNDDRPTGVAIRIAKALGGHTSTETLRRRARRIQELIQTIGPLGGILATAGGSIYTGLKSVMNF